MVSTKQGKFMINASTILFITLQDYHQSRQHHKNDIKDQKEKKSEKAQEEVYVIHCIILINVSFFSSNS
jgi:hypothetical protein